MNRRAGKSSPAGATRGLAIDDRRVQELLVHWLPGQRWFAGGPEEAAAAVVARRETIVSSADVAAELALVHIVTATRDVTYQVFLGWRTKVPERLEHAVIGSAGSLTCYDALHDDDVTTPLLRGLMSGTGIGAIAAVPPSADIPAPLSTEDLGHGLALTAEQSNTSIVFGTAVILKFFRRIEPGVNPDAEMSAALSDRPYTADYCGELRATVDGVDTTLALATRFIRGSADAWSTATASVRDLLAEGDLHADEVGGDFATEAFRLGGVIAQMHLDLAEIFDRRPMRDDDIANLLASIERDAAALTDRLPEMTELLPALRATCRSLAQDLAGTRIVDQRIHGDLHLGQVLRTVDGWIVIDFEGEPSTSLARRRAPKSPLKDIAGMLRSFDYAARYPLYVSTVNAQRAYRSDEWLAHNRAAFLDGYAATYGSDPRDTPALLTAFELAKAVYEVDYELRHRPGWVHIPLDAVRALISPG